jgi:hypothetical protein
MTHESADLANPYSAEQPSPRPAAPSSRFRRVLAGAAVLGSVAAGVVGVGVAGAAVPSSAAVPAAAAAPHPNSPAALCARVPAVDSGGRAPTATNQTFLDGSGQRVHMAIAAGIPGLECRAGDLDPADPEVQAYLADVQVITGALATCAAEPLQYSLKAKGIDPAYSYYNYAERIASRDQAGDLWYACLSRIGTWDQQVNGGDGSVSDLLLICVDDPSTPHADYIKCKKSKDMQRAAARSAEAASRGRAADWIVSQGPAFGPPGGTAGGQGPDWGYEGASDNSFVPDLDAALGITLPPFSGPVQPDGSFTPTPR